MIRFLKLAVLGLLLAFGSAAPAFSQTAPAAAAPGIARVELTAPDGRTVGLDVWQATQERGVVVFSHGFGGSSPAYERILSAWVAEGFTVVAPLHVDSMRHPDRALYDGRAAFTTRLTDLAVARGFVAATRPGKPLIVAGHSFGSLMSLIQGGAVTVAGPMGDGAVQGIIAFSSAGDLPGVVTPDTYASLGAPVLTLTGDADLVEGFVTDWRAHRSAFDRGPASGDNMLLVFAGGDHTLVRDADADDFGLIVRATTDWLKAFGLDDADARARLAALAAPDGVAIERR